MDDREKVISILSEIKPGINYSSSQGLATNHILSSLDIVRLTMSISNEYDIQISPMDIVPENFDTVDEIVALIHKVQDD